MTSFSPNAKRIGSASISSPGRSKIPALFHQFANEEAAVNFSDKDFTTMVEAAADFDDYRLAQYFTKVEARSGSATATSSAASG